jgi:uncharacterized protein YeaO (DUF488 family)
MIYKHMDEAWRDAGKSLRNWIRRDETVERAVLAADLFGKLRVIVWKKPGSGDVPTNLSEKLKEAANIWWTEEVWTAEKDEDPLHAIAWNEGRPDDEIPDRLRFLERHRNRSAWFVETRDPLWRTRGQEKLQGQEKTEGPPLIVFYSFKGGLGRSTALASFAIQRARLGERVAVLDFDLDAPGVGVLLAADERGTIAQWGVVDFLLERDSSVPLSDYYHPCRRADVVGKGELMVFPAGRVDSLYPGKLARVDFELPREPEGVSAIQLLLEAIRKELSPDWILLDARTGLSEPSGALLSGLGHLHLLFGTPSDQSWQGLRVVIERLGPRGAARDLPQADCILVQAMVPNDAETGKRARELFKTQARDEFSERYYTDSPADDERFWDLGDLDTKDAPHVPIPLSYEAKLAHFSDIADVAELLVEGSEYRVLAERIKERFEEASDE